MGKPRLIILVRHAQSEGNKNRDIHQTVPDHRVKLTPEGHAQALEAGRKLRALLRPDDTLHFFTSPYKRTRETTEDILTSLTSGEPDPSPFPRHTIKVYEEPRLREQDFGNFQPCSAEMERMWQERADYGHFFYRIPNGESAADAYDRISGFNDSLWRRFEENDFASVCVLVTHGLMTRVFLMKWYHFSVEYFEDLRNVNHCEFVVMKRSQESGKFILQNQLRTWTEYRRERAARDSLSAGASPVPKQRRWGGCPDGCNHAQHTVAQHTHAHQIKEATRLPLPRRQDTADLFRDDPETHLSPAKSASRPQSALSQTMRSTSASTNRSQEPLSLNHRDTNSTEDASDDRSLPDNEDTILDQDPHHPSSSSSSANVSPSFSSKNMFISSFTPRYPTNNTNTNTNTSNSTSNPKSTTHTNPHAPPITTSFPARAHTHAHTHSQSTYHSISEESSPSPTSHNHFPFPHAHENDNGALTPRPPTDRSPRLGPRPRNPRETALIALAGRDGGGTRSGSGSADDDDLEHAGKDSGGEKAPPSALGLALRGHAPSIPYPQANAHSHSHLHSLSTHPQQQHTITNPPPTSVEALFPPAAMEKRPFDGRALADALGDQSEDDERDEHDDGVGVGGGGGGGG